MPSKYKLYKHNLFLGDGIHYMSTNSKFKTVYQEIITPSGPEVLLATWHSTTCNSIVYIKNKRLHRDDGPAYLGKYSKKFKAFDDIDWIVDGQYINQKVKIWMEENNIPPWREWKIEHQVLFKLRFC